MVSEVHAELQWLILLSQRSHLSAATIEVLETDPMIEKREQEAKAAQEERLRREAEEMLQIRREAEQRAQIDLDVR